MGEKQGMLEALGLTPTAESVYYLMLDKPGHGVAQLAEESGLSEAQVRAALDELADLMLVRASRERPDFLRARSPHTALEEMVRRQEADLAARQAQVASARATVARLVADRANAHSAGSDHLERLVGLDAIQDRLESLGRGATREVVGVHPGASQHPDDLAAGRPLNVEALSRGVAFRTLYQDSVRNDSATVDHANWLMDHGGEVRTAPVVPHRLVVVDGTDALVPLDPADTRKGAMHVSEPGIVAALVDLFEQAWLTAVPLGAMRSRDPETGLSESERELLRLLGTGLTDEAAGRRLGLSLRTVRRMMSSIMERLDAASRFEAGLKAAQRGWL